MFILKWLKSILLDVLSDMWLLIKKALMGHWAE